MRRDIRFGFRRRGFLVVSRVLSGFDSRHRRREPVGRDPVTAAEPADHVVVPSAGAEKQFAKSVSERRVAEGVDEGIDGRIRVAEPQREQLEVVAEPRDQM